MTSFNTYFAALCAFLSCLFGVSLSAADEEPYKLSDERIETINGIIAKSVADKEDLTNPAVIQAIYKRIGAEMPLAPQEPVIQVDLKKLNEEAHARTLKKFKADPEKLKARYAAEAEEKFPMAKIRDKVTVVSKRGAISGVLYKINNNSILVGARTISFIDMDKATRGRFDPHYNKDLRDQYVQERLNDYVGEFNGRQQQIFESLLTAANGENEKNGYIFLKRSEVWKTAQEIASAELAVETVRYRKYKEKQERIRRKREAKELAAREAKEKAEAEAAAASAQAQNAGEAPAGETGTEIPPDQIKDNPFALPTASLDGEKTPENADPQDVLNSADSSANVLQPDEGGTFIALTPEQLAALSRPKVNETAYKALMARIEKEQNEINSKYFGIDADQGFKKALWGFRETDVYYALSKETDAAFIKKLRINRNDILYPEGSRPQKIYLHYHLGELYKVQIFMGDLKQNEFNIYKNSLVQKYGKSDTEKQMGDDVFLRLIEGTLSPDDLPKFTGAKSEEGAGEGAGEARSEEPPAENNSNGENAENFEGEQQENSEQPAEKPYFFVWEGILSRGVLSFYYNRDAGIYEDVVFEKIYLPLRLKKYQEERQAASQPKPAEAPAPAAPAAE